MRLLFLLALLSISVMCCAYTVTETDATCASSNANCSNSSTFGSAIGNILLGCAETGDSTVNHISAFQGVSDSGTVHQSPEDISNGSNVNTVCSYIITQNVHNSGSTVSLTLGSAPAATWHQFIYVLAQDTGFTWAYDIGVNKATTTLAASYTFPSLSPLSGSSTNEVVIAASYGANATCGFTGTFAYTSGSGTWTNDGSSASHSFLAGHSAPTPSLQAITVSFTCASSTAKFAAQEIAFFESPSSIGGTMRVGPTTTVGPTFSR